MAKYAAWGQFMLQTAYESMNSGGVPNTKAGWIRLGISLITALGMHLSSSTDGTK